jgi:hypothetical protein
VPFKHGSVWIGFETQVFFIPFSLHLKKIPPMPVTLPVLLLSSDCISNDLNAKPEKNDMVISKTTKLVFFILVIFYG